MTEIDKQNIKDYVYRSTKVNKDFITFYIKNTHTKDSIKFRYIVLRPQITEIVYKVHKTEIDLWKNKTSNPTVSNMNSIDYKPDDSTTFRYNVYSIEKSDLTFYLKDIESGFVTILSVSVNNFDKISLSVKSNNIYANVYILCDILLQQSIINCIFDTYRIDINDPVYTFVHETLDKNSKIEFDISEDKMSVNCKNIENNDVESDKKRIKKE